MWICLQSAEFVYNQHSLYTISKICKQSAEICIQSAEFVYDQQKLFPAQLGSCSIIQVKKIAAEAPSNFYKSLQIREKRFFPEQEYTLLLYLLELTFVFQRKKYKCFYCSSPICCNTAFLLKLLQPGGKNTSIDQCNGQTTCELYTSEVGSRHLWID